MDDYPLNIDISSDEENNRHSTPTKTQPVNMVGRLDLSDSLAEVWRGSDADLELPQESVSTFEVTGSPKKWRTNFLPKVANQGEALLVEVQSEIDSENYYEEPDSSREMPQLTPAPSLKDITNERAPREEPPNKVDRLDG